MKNLGIYYGATLLNSTDLVESSNRNRIKLEYYGTQKENLEETNEPTYYGISIVKKEYENDKISFEKNTIDKVTTNENEIAKIIKILKSCKVTPIGLEDVLTDLLKRPDFEGI